MTTNAFLLSWDQLGIEAVVPISKYEQWDAVQTMEMLKGNKREACPLDQMISMMKLRARFNTQRHYEIYAIDCDESISEEDWRDMFEQDPQGTADLVRARGFKLYSDRASSDRVRIV